MSHGKEKDMQFLENPIVRWIWEFLGTPEFYIYFLLVPFLIGIFRRKGTGFTLAVVIPIVGYTSGLLPWNIGSFVAFALGLASAAMLHGGKLHENQIR